jgi:hypothetical protein
VDGTKAAPARHDRAGSQSDFGRAHSGRRRAPIDSSTPASELTNDVRASRRAAIAGNVRHAAVAPTGSQPLRDQSDGPLVVDRSRGALLLAETIIRRSRPAHAARGGAACTRRLRPAASRHFSRAPGAGRRTIAALRGAAAGFALAAVLLLAGAHRGHAVMAAADHRCALVRCGRPIAATIAARQRVATLIEQRTPNVAATLCSLPRN